VGVGGRGGRGRLHGDMSPYLIVDGRGGWWEWGDSGARLLFLFIRGSGRRFGGFGVGFGDGAVEIGDEGGVFGGRFFCNEVGPFVGVFLHVVEFFGAVVVLDVTVAIGAEGVVVLTVGGEGVVRPIGLGVLEEGDEGAAFEIGIGGEPAEVGEGGVDGEEFGGLGAALVLRQAWHGDDEGDAGGAFPEGELGPAEFFAEVEAVVGVEDDDGVVGVGGGVEGVEEAAYLFVGPLDASVVRPTFCIL
jgi:hypothetical protein